MYNAKCVGGLARAYTAVLECPTLATVGQSILEVLEPIIARRESEMNACLDGLGTEDCPVPPEDLLDEIRSAIGGVVGTNELGVVTDQGDGIASPVRGRLLLAWARKAEEPDAQCAWWFMQGAPDGKTPPGSASRACSKRTTGSPWKNGTRNAPQTTLTTSTPPRAGSAFMIR